jgi:DNA-binding transcriptional LysR family regulator
VRAVVPNQLAAAVLVARSDLVSLVSIGFATSIREVLDVDFVPAPLPLHRATVQVVWHPRFDADRGHRWVREQLYDLASTLGLRR